MLQIVANILALSWLECC